MEVFEEFSWRTLTSCSIMEDLRIALSWRTLGTAGGLINEYFGTITGAWTEIFLGALVLEN